VYRNVFGCRRQAVTEGAVSTVSGRLLLYAREAATRAVESSCNKPKKSNFWVFSFF